MKKIDFIDYLLTPAHFLFFVGALIVFDLVQRIFIIPDKLGLTKRGHQVAIRNLNYALLFSLKVIGIKFKIEKKASYDPNKIYIIVSNHESMFDIPLIYVALKELYPRFIAKRELSKFIPSVSFNLRQGGNVIIDRDNPRQSLKAIEDFARRMKEENFSGTIFPEGTRARDGVLKKYRLPGFSTLFKNLPEAEIIPVTISNSWQLSARKFGPIARSLTITITTYPALKRTKELTAPDTLSKCEEIAHLR